MSNNRDFTLFTLFVVGIAAMLANVANIIQADEIEELQKQPTYHCDGSTTMGYAVPGTPEAAACWFEVKK